MKAIWKFPVQPGRFIIEKKRYIEVVAYETDEVVQRVDVSNRSPAHADHIMDGMDRNLNHEKFYTRFSEQFPHDA